jgi:hypothetical protein
MSAFTRLGSAIWDWEPWTELGASARILWLALYTSAEAKRHIPGLWQGGIPSMADAARMSADDVRMALDQLLERELVEYDPKFRVLRLCELPDAGEYPTNGNVIRSWWTKFNTVPACPVRDAHVRTIAWILDTGSKRLRGQEQKVTANHKVAWGETFAAVEVPVSRRRGLRRLADNDTGTPSQPSLFPSKANSVPMEHAAMQISTPSYPQETDRSVDNSAVLRQLNNNAGPERVTERVCETLSVTNGIPDLGSRIPDLSSLSGEGGWGGGHESGMRPSLTLVPPYTVIHVLEWLAQGNWDQGFDKAYQDALGALILRWVSAGVVQDDWRALAEYNTHSGRRWNARLLVGCDIHAEVATARRTLDWRDVQSKTLLAKL